MKFDIDLKSTNHAFKDSLLRFGKVDDIKIIRKNANGQPLREFLYGFIVMSNEDEGREAMMQLNHHNE